MILKLELILMCDIVGMTRYANQISQKILDFAKAEFAIAYALH